MEYTKGEWEVTKHRPLDNLVIVIKHGEHAYNDDRICQVDVAPKAKANAHLIAAAPDMYEALKEIKHLLETHELQDVVLQQVLEGKCYLALVKAEGK